MPGLPASTSQAVNGSRLRLLATKSLLYLQLVSVFCLQVLSACDCMRNDLMPVVCVLLVLLSNEDNARLLLSVEAGATAIFLVLVVIDKPFACDEGDDHATFATGDKAQIVALLCVLVQLSIMLLWLEASGSIPARGCFNWPGFVRALLSLRVHVATVQRSRLPEMLLAQNHGTLQCAI